MGSSNALLLYFLYLHTTIELFSIIVDFLNCEMGVAPKDAVIPEKALTSLIIDKHIDFIAKYEINEATKYDYSMSESLRMSGIYWAQTALDIMNASQRMEKIKVMSLLVEKCNVYTLGQRNMYILIKISRITFNIRNFR